MLKEGELENRSDELFLNTMEELETYSINPPVEIVAMIQR